MDGQFSAPDAVVVVVTVVDSWILAQFKPFSVMVKVNKILHFVESLGKTV